jgi:putative tryptophan/tyrosine transport system substrate-binding protein
MRRREFITLLSGLAAWPLTARAQQPALPVIGFLSSESPALFANLLDAFRQGLREVGYVDGQNVAIEYRWAEGQNDRLPALATDLVHRRVRVIAAPVTTPGALAAKAATATIPIVFFTGGDPVALGLVASLSRPGGNITGVTSLGEELAAKRLELMHELMPSATIMALLVNPANTALIASTTKAAQIAARALGLQLHILQASTEGEFDTVFATLAQLRASALVIAVDSFFTGRREQLAALALRHRMPAIYQSRDFAEAGGLMSYSANLREALRLVGIYTGRIVKGEKPADLPVQQATKVELIINLKVAKTLGITVPNTLIGRADGVIE